MRRKANVEQRRRDLCDAAIDRIELVSRAMEPFIAYWWSTAGGSC